MESDLITDYTMYQIRSFAYCSAERTASHRLHRLDELKSVIDQIFDSKGFDRYVKLKEEIVDSYSIEEGVTADKSSNKKELSKHNKEAFQSLAQFIRG